MGFGVVCYLGWLVCVIGRLGLFLLLYLRVVFCSVGCDGKLLCTTSSCGLCFGLQWGVGCGGQFCLEVQVAASRRRSAKWRTAAKFCYTPLIKKGQQLVQRILKRPVALLRRPTPLPFSA